MKLTSEIINQSNTWQIGTGDDTRMYHDIFLRLGVAFLGPGDPGKEGEQATEEHYKENGGNNWGAVLKQVKKGQWLIARKGKGYIVALGEVTEEYNYTNLFSDVEGWDLQHFVKVKWYKPKTINNWLEMDSYCLSQSTLQGCNVQDVYNIIYQTEFEEYPAQVSIETVTEKKLEIKNLIDSLVEHGIRVQDADNVGITIERIIRLARYYTSYHYNVSEAEIIAFLIAPTLIAFGWSEQKIKFQISNIDIALFKNAYEQDDEQTPLVIIEAKKFNNGLAFTDGQIKTYSTYYPNCKKFLATNGFRFKYFEKENDELVCKGYFNLLNLKERDVLRGLPKTSIETMLSISNFI